MTTYIKPTIEKLGQLKTLTLNSNANPNAAPQA